jgi:methionyl-tRNA formyltransferase
LRILFAGTPPNAAQTLEALISAGLDVVGVLTREDAQVGRKKTLTQSAVADVAEKHDLRAFKHNQVDQQALNEIQTVSPDIGIVVAYGALLNSSALSALPHGWINLHYSLLPELRGAAPVQHAILQGLKTTGITIFQLDEGMDTGDILLQVPTEIHPAENSANLLARLTQLGIGALLELAPQLAAGFETRTKQSGVSATFAPKLSRAKARIDWLDSADRIENLVNAMNPEPMSWTTHLTEPVRILSGRQFAITDSNVSDNIHQAGECFIYEGRVLTKCGENTHLELLELQPSGKQPMAATAWFRGKQSKGQVIFE